MKRQESIPSFTSREPSKAQSLERPNEKLMETDRNEITDKKGTDNICFYTLCH